MNVARTLTTPEPGTKVIKKNKDRVSRLALQGIGLASGQGWTLIMCLNTHLCCCVSVPGTEFAGEVTSVCTVKLASKLGAGGPEGRETAGQREGKLVHKLIQV